MESIIVKSDAPASMTMQFIVVKEDHEGSYTNMYGPFDSATQAWEWINTDMSVFADHSNFFVQEIFNPNR